MSFKYQAPANYKATSITIAGVSHEIKSGIIESKQDIYNILAPIGFTRFIVEPKKEATKS